MIVPLLLVAYAVSLAVFTPRVLQQASWPARAPRLGVLAWQAALFSVIGAVSLSVLAAAAPTSRLSLDLEHVLHACFVALSRQELDTATLGTGGVAVLAVAALLRLAWALQHRVRALRQQRVDHRTVLDLLAEEGTDGTLVLPADVAVAYCLPGRHSRVVFTSAAREQLDSEQCAAVLAHERAHLSGRHDLVLLAADVAATAFRNAAFFRVAKLELRTLVEMLADDEAVKRTGRVPLASALVGLGCAAAAPGALGAADHAVLRRVQRLVRADNAVSPWQSLTVLLGVAIVFMTPIVVAVAPAWAAQNGLCLLTG